MAGTNAVPNQRTRQVYAKGNQSLISDARWPVWAALMLWSDFGCNERNHYDVFRQRAYVPRMQRYGLYRLLALQVLTIKGRGQERKKIRGQESYLVPQLLVPFTP